MSTTTQTLTLDAILPIALSSLRHDWPSDDDPDETADRLTVRYIAGPDGPKLAEISIRRDRSPLRMTLVSGATVYAPVEMTVCRHEAIRTVESWANLHSLNEVRAEIARFLTD